MRRKRFSFLLGALISLASGFPGRGENAPEVSIIVDSQPGPAATHGLVNLMAALRSKDIRCEQVAKLDTAKGDVLIVAGEAGGSGPAAQALSEAERRSLRNPESLLIRQALSPQHKPLWLITGADDRGLMYGELDVAARIGWSTNRHESFSELREIAEQPSVSTRAISIYTMNRAYWESRFYDEAYWARYLDTLAENRFNSLVVIFGYENGGFLAPCYPYFFNVEGFPEVQMVGITGEQQRRNLAALNRLIEMAHERGVEFSVGIWDHIYRGGVQGGGVPGADELAKKPTPGLVWGVTGENLASYTKAALAELVRLVPRLDGIQFRMHDESGLKNTEQVDFWHAVFKSMKDTAPNLRLDLRAKGLPDTVIQDAVNTGVKFRITTKYWMEQMGLPFHPTHINTQDQQNRRHSYADLLRYPQTYKIHWRLWNGGTARVLLWADPDYARRFVESTHLYDGEGFEVNEPLCTKMEAQPHDARPFELLTPPHRYYDYEFERYWHFFQVFGRLGYNPNTPPDVWQHEFEKRFGRDAATFVEAGLHRASWVLPRIVASCYPYSHFPMTRGWPEKQRLGDLPFYAKAEGSDTAQFENFDEEAQLLLENGETAKVRPAETSRWFARTANDINAQISEAEKRIGQYRCPEFDSTMTDLKILANLALYHSRRIPAAVSYRLFERTKDSQSLDDAIRYEGSAVEAWRQLVSAAGDFYTSDLMMGVRGSSLCGHWKDELDALEKGRVLLQEERRASAGAVPTRAAPRFSVERGPGDNEPPVVMHVPVTNSASSKALTIAAVVSDPSGVKWVHLRYRSVNQRLEYQTLPMLPTGQAEHYQAVIPAGALTSEWDLMYYLEVMDNRGNGAIYPNLNKETPYIVVKWRS